MGPTCGTFQCERSHHVLSVKLRDGNNQTDRMSMYPLVMTSSSPWYRWPIEKEVYLLNMVMFHGSVK
jgi:hypothetical protein